MLFTQLATHDLAVVFLYPRLRQLVSVHFHVFIDIQGLYFVYFLLKPTLNCFTFLHIKHVKEVPGHGQATYFIYSCHALFNVYLAGTVIE